MKKMWNMLRGRARRDNRGMSFVEVLCAVAIFALVAGVIGTVVVMSTRTYKKGISETGIQQEAQLAANNIGNMVKDACSVVYGESGQQYLENGADLMLNPDNTPKMQAAGFTELSIMTNENIQYTMTYDEVNSMLMYQEFGSDGSALTGTEIMANNIVAFTADTTDFKNSKTIKLNMTVEDKSTNRRIPMEYTMTSRNDAVSGAVYVSHTEAVVLMFEDSDVVLVPGETYKIPLVVAGNITQGLDWVSWGSLETVSLTLDYAEVRVPVGTTSTMETITVHTKDMDEEGNYKATASCNVLIRRVDSVQVTHSVDTKNSTGGMYETAGTVYTFTASVSGNELGKHVAYDYDREYKTAQAVVWSCVLKVNGTENTYNWTSAQNGAGVWEFTAPDFTTGTFANYFEVTSTKEDALVPSFVIKAKKAMPASMELTVRATSKHASGANKADSKYYDGLGIDPKNIYYGEDTLKPRETKLNQGLEITLEPHETGEVKVGMKGGVSNDVTFDYHDASDVRSESNTNGTIAVYNEADDTVAITLGKDEKGSGKEGTVPYTFTVDVKVSGVTKTTITVHVCRIDEISIEVKDNFKDNKGNTMALPTYDFRARFNVDNGSITDMNNVVKNLIQYKTDGTVDEAAVRKTLSSRITWEVINHNNNGKVEYKDSVVCMAGVGSADKGTIVGSYSEKYEKEGGAKFTVVNVKPARIEQDTSGSWIIKQLPEIDISPSSNTLTGLPKNYEIKVTMEALHPLGTDGGKSYNKTDKLYKDDVKASASIFGDMTISAPSPLVIVEPGQGINSTEQSDREIVIPISVGGVAVYSMTATIENADKTDSATQLASYSGGNPYAAGTATSANNKRTWYLGLIIGENEMGNSNGRIRVHVDAYNTSKEVVASTDFELGVRRVDNVDVRIADGKKISAVNKEGGTMTLDAFPKGRGSNGTEFYDIQKDENGNVFRWEQKGHGGYIEPSPMEWRLVMKGVEKPLSEWTEYIDASSIKTSVNESDHKATVSFKLKQMIPYGSKLRAYSLHARGNNGKDAASADYVKYNKSGKKYANTYGELELLDDGFQRADEFTFVENIPNMRDGFTDWAYDSSQRSFFRYRIKNGTWSPYYLLEDESPQIARFIGTKESLVFLPEYDYDLEIINVVFSKSKKLIYWPLDETLLETGRGWTEEGFRLWNGDEIMKSAHSGDAGMLQQEHDLYNKIKASKEQWLWTFDVPRITINFEIGDARQWKTKDTSVTLANMSASSPIHLQGDPANTWTPMDEIAVKLAPTSFCLWKRQYNMNAYIDQKINGEWQEVAVTSSGWDAPRPKPNNVTSNQTYWHLQTSCPQFQIYQVYSGSSAEYRIRTMIKDMEWMNIEGRLFDRKYVGYNRDTSLFDLATGEGVLYVKFN
ncbi:MAG: prepilin-type N-terminal cleavage/methylation domain-containing protein [Lachnospiraceae bacterium]|nr:prepilin-type N-terminal cleavage/methylation domain-containing protein [Lachnospiraceae bacterium]